MADQIEAIEREAQRKAEADSDCAPTFRGAALEAQHVTNHEWMLAGPAETGKTFAALWRLDTLLRTTPRAKAALVRKVAGDIGPTVLQTYQRIIALSHSGATPYGGNKPEWYSYPNGSRLYLGGMDRPGKVLSGERDFVFVNQAEELMLEDWETLTTRVTGRGAVTETPMIFGDCNPGPPTHWILSRPTLRMLYSRHEDNPTLFDERGELTDQGRRAMGILGALTGVRYRRLRLGQWAAAEGAVYEEFDRAVHLVDRFPIPPTWPRYRAIDFGYTNPFVCQWWATDHDGRAYLYREIYMTQRIVRDHAATIKRVEGWYLPDGTLNPQRERITASVADHDAEDRATLKAEGIETIPARKEITVGIQAVQVRLRAAGDGKPRLFVMRDSLVEVDERLRELRKPVCTEQEFDGYVWPKGQDGKPVKEVPVDVDNHGMDAMRYAVMYAEGGGAPTVSPGGITQRSLWRGRA